MVNDIVALDKGPSDSKGLFKAVWSQADTLDLIDAVKNVEDAQLLLGAKSKKVNNTSKGNKWEQVASMMPNCWMSSSKRFSAICRGKFQELRRNYQAMLRNHTTRKFSTEEVRQKMKDYFDDVPPLHFFENVPAPILLENGNCSPVRKIMNVEGMDLKVIEDNNCKSPKSTCSESGEKQQIRRSSRIPRRSCRLEESVEQDGMVASAEKFTFPEARSLRSSVRDEVEDLPKRRSGRKRVKLDVPEIEIPLEKDKLIGPIISEQHRIVCAPERFTYPDCRNSRRTSAGGKKQRKGRKPARAEVPHYIPEHEDITELFKTNFELLRKNIDFSTEFHLHKHLHRHFKEFQDHMTRVVDKIDKKIDRLDRRIGSLEMRGPR